MKTLRVLNDDDIRAAIVFWLKSQGIVVKMITTGTFETPEIEIVVDNDDGVMANVETDHGADVKAT